MLVYPVPPRNEKGPLGKYGYRFALVAFLELALAPACGPVTYHCLRERGECPTPDVGVAIDNGTVKREVWYANQSLGVDPFANASLLCAVDVPRSTPGKVLLFQGPRGLVILDAIDGVASDPLVFPTFHADNVGFVNLDKDPQAEFDVHQDVLYPDSDPGIGPQVFAPGFDDYTDVPYTEGRIEPSSVVYDDDGTRLLISGYLPLGWVDIDRDGIFENVDADDTTITVFRLDGSVVFRAACDRCFGALGVDFDGDDSLEVVARRFVEYDPNQGTQGNSSQVIVFSQDGSQVSTFSIPRAPYLRVAHSNNGSPGEYLLVNDSAVDKNGMTICNDITSAVEACGLVTIRPQSPEMFEGCPYLPEESGVVTFRPRNSLGPHRIEISYSFVERVIENCTPLFFSCSTDYPIRSIVRIYSEEGELVYYEVLDSGSRPGSYVTASSNIEGEEVFLLADDDRILAFRSSTH